MSEIEDKLNKLVKDLSEEMVKALIEENRKLYGDNWRERLLTEDLPIISHLEKESV